MKHILFNILLALSLASLAQSQVVGQETKQSSKNGIVLTEREREAREELKLAAHAYKAGKFAEAEQHAKRALELNPDDKDVLFFIARAIHAQYRPGVETPENQARAREAIKAYQRIVEKEPGNEEADKSVAALYGALKEEALQREWIVQRASNAAVSDDRRAEAYTMLAGKDWNCSYEITERTENKEIVTKGGSPIIRYRKPKDQIEFNKAQQCAMSGMEMTEMALILSPQNDMAWSYKTNLLLEMAKLAEMSDQHDLKAEYKRQADEAMKRGAELSEENQVTAAAADDDRSRTTQADATTTTITDPASSLPVTTLPREADSIYGSVPTGRATSIPKPVYPRDVHGVSGTVKVQVIIDETGNVIQAQAVSGHPSLHAAAVEAARRAKFSPTILSGQPVKASGMITYNFVPGANFH